MLLLVLVLHASCCAMSWGMCVSVRCCALCCLQARRAELAASVAAREAAARGKGEGAAGEGEEEEVPHEFLDPILMTIMQVRSRGKIFLCVRVEYP